MKLTICSFLLAFGAGCGAVADVPDAARDAAPDVEPDAPRLFCSSVLGAVDASAPSPGVYECKRPGDRCWFGPGGAYWCCQPDGGAACIPPK